MQQNVDPRKLLGAMHFQASGELMRLLDGFFSNIEDGLFELAYSNSDGSQQRKTIELMREMRFRREHLLKTFGKRMQRSVHSWFDEDLTKSERMPIAWPRAVVATLVFSCRPLLSGSLMRPIAIWIANRCR